MESGRVVVRADVVSLKGEGATTDEVDKEV
jgi:hypothetical protein